VHVSLVEWLVIAATVMAASTIQGVVGFGSSLLAVPIVAMIAPAALPGAMVFPSVPMTLAMAFNEREHVDGRGSRLITLGRLPGTAVGVAIVALVSREILTIGIGSIVLAAVCVSIFAAHLHPGVTRSTAAVTGFLTGITGTAAAIDGPPLALLYQHHPQSVFRATLATQFAIGTVFSLTGLLVAGQLHGWQVLLGVSLMPSFLLGFLLSAPIRRRLHSRNLRPAVLAIAALTGVAAILRAVI